MNVRDIAFIGVRLMAIYLALNAIYSIAGIAETVVALTTGAFGAEAVKPSAFVYYGLISTFLYLLFALILWLSAGRLAQAISPARLAPSGEKQLRKSEFQAMAFSVVGLLILVSALSKIGGELYKAYLISNAFNVSPEISFADKAQRLQIGVEALFGLVLLVWGGTLSGLLVWFRRLGLSTKTSSSRVKGDARKRRAP